MPVQRASSEKLNEFFLELVRRSFGQLGMGDRAIVEYVASVLTEFSHSDQWLRLRNAEGKRLTSTVEMMLAQENETLDLGGTHRMGAHAAQICRRLRPFMSGLFRHFVERGGYLNYYLEEGPQSYQAVSALDLSLYRPGFLVFEELGKSFENYSGALDFMRKCYFATGPKEDPFAGFFQQIQGWVRHGISHN